MSTKRKGSCGRREEGKKEEERNESSEEGEMELEGKESSLEEEEDEVEFNYGLWREANAEDKWCKEFFQKENFDSLTYRKICLEILCCYKRKCVTFSEVLQKNFFLMWKEYTNSLALEGSLFED